MDLRCSYIKISEGCEIHHLQFSQTIEENIFYTFVLGEDLRDLNIIYTTNANICALSWVNSFVEIGQHLFQISRNVNILSNTTTSFSPSFSTLYR